MISSNQMKRIDRILLVAAPSCCGKSTFIRSLVAGEHPDIAETFQLGDPKEWLVADAFYFSPRAVDWIDEHSDGRSIVHWTIPRPGLKLALRNLWLRNAYDRQERLAVLEAAKSVSVLTLFDSAENLTRHVQFRRDRISERRQSGEDPLTMYLSKSWDIRSLADLYSDLANLVPMYDRWFEFCADLAPGDRFMVDLSAGHSLIPADEWSTVRSRWLATS
jgi:hypothetical protein